MPIHDRLAKGHRREVKHDLLHGLHSSGVEQTTRKVKDAFALGAAVLVLRGLREPLDLLRGFPEEVVSGVGHIGCRNSNSRGLVCLLQRDSAFLFPVVYFEFMHCWLRTCVRLRRLPCAGLSSQLLDEELYQRDDPYSNSPPVAAGVNQVVAERVPGADLG
ncbi:MAG: hypothetical protein ACK53Y_22410, partial [bacterium]